MQTVQVTREFVAISPVFPNEIRVVEEQPDGTILVTKARYDSAYIAACRNDFRMPPRHEWEPGGWRHHESYVPSPGFMSFVLCRQHFDHVCGCRIIVLSQ